MGHILRPRLFLYSLEFQRYKRGLPYLLYKGADKSLARPERKKATATEDFEFHTSYL